MECTNDWCLLVEIDGFLGAAFLFWGGGWNLLVVFVSFSEFSRQADDVIKTERVAGTISQDGMTRLSKQGLPKSFSTMSVG